MWKWSPIRALARQLDTERLAGVVAQRNAAQQELGRLHLAINDLAEHVWFSNPYEDMTCGEVDAYAFVLLLGGHRQVAINLLASHAMGAEQDQDEPHRCNEPTPVAAMAAMTAYAQKLLPPSPR